MEWPFRLRPRSKTAQNEKGRGKLFHRSTILVDFSNIPNCLLFFINKKKKKKKKKKVKPNVLFDAKRGEINRKKSKNTENELNPPCEKIAGCISKFSKYYLCDIINNLTRFCMSTKLNSEDFSEIMKAQFEALKQAVDAKDFYRAELGFVNTWKEIGRQVFEELVKEPPQGQKKVKKFPTTLGVIAIEKDHPFTQMCGGFKISPLLQEKMVYAGHLASYEKGVDALERMCHVKVSRAQLNRVTDYYGKQLASTANEERNLKPVLEKECLYVEADASMGLTRDGDPRWKEVKLGRLFNSSDCLRIDAKPSIINHSQYIAHMGDHASFIKKMDPLIESFGSLKERLVFISDGATWIRNWIEDSFSDATSILDFYHAGQYLYEYAHSVYPQDEKEAKRWAEEQKKLLLESKLPAVTENIRKLSPRSKAGKKILTYYAENRRRIDYKKYLSMGARIIGSGAIESAHRTVIQARMKLSGQRWSKRGAQNMLNLRIVAMNHRWDKVIQMVGSPKSIAA